MRFWREENDIMSGTFANEAISPNKSSSTHGQYILNCDSTIRKFLHSVTAVTLMAADRLKETIEVVA